MCVGTTVTNGTKTIPSTKGKFALTSFAGSVKNPHNFKGAMVRIASINNHGCVRMHKMNLVLLAKGHEVHLCTSELTTFIDDYTSYTLASTFEQLQQWMKNIEPYVDMLHAHNEPSYYVSLWKEVSNKPVILDVHDSYLIRSTPEEFKTRMDAGNQSLRISTEERTNFQLADGLVFPSESMRELVCKEFKLTQPSLTLPSYLPERFYQYEAQQWYGGLVYEGRTIFSDKEGPSSYCDYRELAKECDRLKIDFHLYGNQDSKEYDEAYPTAIRHKPCLMHKMIKRIQAFDWGLVGNIKSYENWEKAMPNKLFEYMAANVPVVCINAGEAAKFVLKHDVGIVVNDLEELRNRWKEHTEKRKNIVKLRRKFSMESHIGELEQFYRGVLSGN